MISMYFGLPGSGKTTLLASLAVKGLSKGSPYKHVYSNVKMNIPGLWYITVEDFFKFKIKDGLILIDEASICLNGRNFKQTPKNVLDFLYLHRHAKVDIYFFSQCNNIDKTVRTIADRCFYIYKGIFTGKWFSKCYRIPYTMFLSEKDSQKDHPGEIEFGYYKPTGFDKLFQKWIFRPKWYKYYDSWEFPELPELPEDREFKPKVDVINEKSRKKRKKKAAG